MMIHVVVLLFYLYKCFLLLVVRVLLLLFLLLRGVIILCVWRVVFDRLPHFWEYVNKQKENNMLNAMRQLIIVFF